QRIFTEIKPIVQGATSQVPRLSPDEVKAVHERIMKNNLPRFLSQLEKMAVMYFQHTQDAEQTKEFLLNGLLLKRQFDNTGRPSERVTVTVQQCDEIIKKFGIHVGIMGRLQSKMQASKSAQAPVAPTAPVAPVAPVQKVKQEIKE